MPVQVIYHQVFNSWFFPYAFYFLRLVELWFLYEVVHYYSFFTSTYRNKWAASHLCPQSLHQGYALQEFIVPSAAVGTLLLILPLAHGTGGCHIFSRTFYIHLPCHQHQAGCGCIQAVKQPNAKATPLLPLGSYTAVSATALQTGWAKCCSLLAKGLAGQVWKKWVTYSPCKRRKCFLV